MINKSKNGMLFLIPILTILIIMACIISTVQTLGTRSLLRNTEQTYLTEQSKMLKNTIISSIEDLPYNMVEWISYNEPEIDDTDDIDENDINDSSNDNDDETEPEDDEEIEYEKRKVLTDTFIGNRVNIIAILDKNGNILQDDYYDYRKLQYNQKPSNIDIVYRSIFQNNQKKCNNQKTKTGTAAPFETAGFIMINNIPSFVATYTTVDKKGNCDETIIFCRFITLQELTHITNTTNEILSIKFIESSFFTPDELKQFNEDNPVIKTNKNEIITYTDMDNLVENNNGSIMLIYSNESALPKLGDKMSFAIIMTTLASCIAIFLTVTLMYYRLSPIHPDKITNININKNNINKENIIKKPEDSDNNIQREYIEINNKTTPDEFTWKDDIKDNADK